MSAASVLARARAAAVALMVDACTITRVTGSTTSPVTGVVTEVTTTVYAGVCRVQDKGALGAASSSDTVGQAFLRQLGWQLQLPMSVTGLAVGDRVTVTSSAHDPDLVGRVFAVRDLFHGTHKTARRVAVEELT